MSRQKLERHQVWLYLGVELEDALTIAEDVEI